MSLLPTKKSEIVTEVESQVILIYGRAKIGKSTLVSHFDSPLFLATEAGLNHLSVHKINITNWNTFLEACKELSEKAPKEYKTIAIDTIDKLVVFCSDYICAENGINHPSDLPHGRGWGLVTSEFNRVLSKLAQMPYGLVMVSHCQQEQIETATSKYNRWTISVGGKNKGIVVNMCDLILFIDSEVGDDGKEVRIIKTKPSKYYEAGDRTNKLPAVIPMDYKEIAKYLNKTEKVEKTK